VIKQESEYNVLITYCI